MKKILLLIVMVLGTTNMYAQDYDLQGLAKACEKYQKVSDFHNGRALVRLKQNNSNESFVSGSAYIDKNGNEVIPCKYDTDGTFNSEDFSEGLAVVYVDEHYGYIDTNGNMVVQPTFDNAMPFVNGIAVVRKNGKYGAIDKSGKVIVPFAYDLIENFYFSHAICCKGEKLGVVDKAGKFTENPLFDSVGSAISLINTESVEKRGFDFISFNQNGKTGAKNRIGKVVIPCVYDAVGMGFFDGLARVIKNGKTGYINKTGQVVIPFQFKAGSSYDFNEGIARIEKDGKYGYIDKTGKTIIPCIYSYAKEFFTEGFAAVLKNGKYGYIDRNGNAITEFVFDEARKFSDGLALVKVGDNWGFVDKHGNSSLNYMQNISQSVSQEIVDSITNDNQSTIEVVEVAPSFVGGIEQFNKWLAANVHYPELALENGIKGTVIATVAIEPDGSIGEVKIKKGVDPLLDKETIRVFKSMPRWNPGTQNGNPVRVILDMPLNFYFTE